MTLRDIGKSFSGLWQAIQDDVRTVFSENILDWPIWVLVVAVLLLVGIVAPSLSTVKREEESANIDDGIWGSIWAALIGLLAMSYLIFAAFTERHGLQSWVGFIGLISWPIFGYSFLLKLRHWLRK